MKKLFFPYVFSVLFMLPSCSDTTNNNDHSEHTSGTEPAMSAGGQETVDDQDSEKDVVKVAVGSKDHTTLVKALKQAELVTSLSNTGPFTVFAPTNAAFEKVPKETLDQLMTEEKKSDLQNILQYHVTVSAMKAETFTDGQVMGMVNGDNVRLSVKDGKVTINNSATIIASIPASNGIIHVIDGVLLPPAK